MKNCKTSAGTVAQKTSKISLLARLPLLLAILMLCAVLSSCTGNQRARKYGGKEELHLKPNEKLINITWKESNMWVLTEDTLTHIKYFRESSSWGIWNGEIVVK